MPGPGIPIASIAGMDEFDAVARTEVQPGWDVLDADGNSLGVVDEVHASSFSVRGARADAPLLDVAFADIESADDGRVELAVSGDALGAVDTESEGT